MKYVSFLFVLIWVLAGCGKTDRPHGPVSGEQSDNELNHADEARLDTLLAQYAPYKMTYDASALPEKEKAMLQKLVAASELINKVYLQQTSKEGIAYRDLLRKDSEKPINSKLLTLLRRNGMPYDQLKDNEVFMGDTPFFGGGEVYPRDMTIAQFDDHFKTLSPEEQAEWMYPYTVIRKDDQHGYKAVRYHVAYKEYVDEISRLLREAADLADNESFVRYLRLKAGALQSDNYFDADVAWIEVAGNKYEICIGPFETYSDQIKGVKAKYESFVEVVDQKESARLAIYTKYLQAMEQNLPIPDEYKSNVDKLTAKFVIVQGVHRGGEAIAGYQAVAANLPNDVRVHAVMCHPVLADPHVLQKKPEGVVKLGGAVLGR